MEDDSARRPWEIAGETTRETDARERREQEAAEREFHEALFPSGYLSWTGA